MNSTSSKINFPKHYNNSIELYSSNNELKKYSEIDSELPAILISKIFTPDLNPLEGKLIKALIKKKEVLNLCELELVSFSLHKLVFMTHKLKLLGNKTILNYLNDEQIAHSTSSFTTSSTSATSTTILKFNSLPTPIPSSSTSLPTPKDNLKPKHSFTPLPSINSIFSKDMFFQMPPPRYQDSQQLNRSFSSSSNRTFFTQPTHSHGQIFLNQNLSSKNGFPLLPCNNSQDGCNDSKKRKVSFNEDSIRKKIKLS